MLQVESCLANRSSLILSHLGSLNPFEVFCVARGLRLHQVPTPHAHSALVNEAILLDQANMVNNLWRRQRREARDGDRGPEWVRDEQATDHV